MARTRAAGLSSRLAGAAFAIRRAFAEFLLVPTCIIVGFLLLAAGTHALDRGYIQLLQPARDSLTKYVFADVAGTRDLLATIAGALITVTTLTTTLLLIALQQSASSLTSQVYDQFLRRRNNQFSFGFFVGLSLYALVTLASVGPLNPVLGAALTFLLTIVALCLLLLLFYTTIDQMRPVVIMETIHNHILTARKTQTRFLRKVRRASCCDAPLRVPVAATTHGFVHRIDVEAIAAAATRASAEVEVVMQVCIGSFVAYRGVLAEVKAHTREDAIALGTVVEGAIEREPQRDIATDPLAGIQELENIAWTSISTALSNPDPGLLAIYSLRDVLARWSEVQDDPQDGHDGQRAPIVYADDVVASLMNAFESLAVSASESMQHQTYAAILRTFTVLFDRLPAEHQRRAEELILRTLPALGDHVLTAELNAALTGMIEALERARRVDTAAAVKTARDTLALSVGKLRSRATRAP